jgi:hypothetical protein
MLLFGQCGSRSTAWALLGPRQRDGLKRDGYRRHNPGIDDELHLPIRHRRTLGRRQGNPFSTRWRVGHSVRSVPGSSIYGGARSNGAVRRTGRRGGGSQSWLMTFSPGAASFIRGLKSALALSTRGGSRVPELGTLGSVRGRSAMSVPTAISGLVQPHLAGGKRISFGREAGGGEAGRKRTQHGSKHRCAAAKCESSEAEARGHSGR